MAAQTWASRPGRSSWLNKKIPYDVLYRSIPPMSKAMSGLENRTICARVQLCIFERTFPSYIFF
jgi:hypothetical protein